MNRHLAFPIPRLADTTVDARALVEGGEMGDRVALYAAVEHASSLEETLVDKHRAPSNLYAFTIGVFKFKSR
jgi:hypothetical protein